MSAELRTRLLRQIEAAFAGVKYPGDKHISTDEFELQDVVGKWQSLSYDIISSHLEITFFTPEGLKYYLPAYMIAVVEHPDAVDIGAAINRRLTPPLGVAWKTQKLSMGADFTTEQKAAIRAFFEAYRELCPDAFWEDIGDKSSLLETWKRGVEYWQMYG